MHWWALTNKTFWHTITFVNMVYCDCILQTILFLLKPFLTSYYFCVETPELIASLVTLVSLLSGALAKSRARGRPSRAFPPRRLQRHSARSDIKSLAKVIYVRCCLICTRRTSMHARGNLICARGFRHWFAFMKWKLERELGRQRIADVLRVEESSPSWSPDVVKFQWGGPGCERFAQARRWSGS